MILLYIIIVLFVVYASFVLYYWHNWKTIPYFTATTQSPQTTISVINPARNEEENIGNLLTALQEQTYNKSLFEVIVVDDHSVDKTAVIVQQFPSVRLLQLKEDNINSYKKKAIEMGIAIATGELIVTTDADCVPTKEWLQIIAQFKETRLRNRMGTEVIRFGAPDLGFRLKLHGLFGLDFQMDSGVVCVNPDIRNVLASLDRNLARFQFQCLRYGIRGDEWIGGELDAHPPQFEQLSVLAPSIRFRHQQDDVPVLLGPDVKRDVSVADGH